MAEFAPINDDHAITSVIFTLALDEIIEPPTLSAAMSQGPWRDTLPGVSRLPDAQITAFGQTFETPAMQAAIVRPDGRPIWALRLSGTELSVECTNYTRWDAVWGQAFDYLSQAWKIVAEIQPNIQIMEYRLAVTDTFFTESDSYLLSDLFADRAPILSPVIREDAEIWHVNVGWVDVAQASRTFETVQAQSTGQREGYEGRGPYAVTLAHMLRTSVDQNPHRDLSSMSSIISDLHVRNKALLLKNLRPDVLGRIGLK